MSDAPTTRKRRPREPAKQWPITMTEASHITRLPYYAGSHAEIAREYGVTEELIRQIREDKGYNGVRLG